MAKDVACPVCDADLVFAGDERPGDVVACHYCTAPFTVTSVARDDEEWELEEDF